MRPFWCKIQVISGGTDTLSLRISGTDSIGSPLNGILGIGKGLKELETSFLARQERMKMSETTDTQIQTYLSGISDSYIYEEVWLS